MPLPQNTVRPGIWVLGCGALWALLSAWLWLRGHAPTGPGLGAHHYGLQAVLIGPWLWLTWRLSAKWSGVAPAATARGLCLPLIVFWLLPECVAYAVAGFAGLSKTMAIGAPLAVAGQLWILRNDTGSWARAAKVWAIAAVLIATWVR